MKVLRRLYLPIQDGAPVSASFQARPLTLIGDLDDDDPDIGSFAKQMWYGFKLSQGAQGFIYPGLPFGYFFLTHCQIDLSSQRPKEAHLLITKGSPDSICLEVRTTSPRLQKRCSTASTSRTPMMRSGMCGVSQARGLSTSHHTCTCAQLLHIAFDE